MIRPVGAVLAEQHDEWAERRRYLSRKAMKNARAVLTAQHHTHHQSEEVGADRIASAIHTQPNDVNGSPLVHHNPDLTPAWRQWREVALWQ